MENHKEDLYIVKKGFLHIKRPPSNAKIRLKAWQKKYVILQDDSHESIRRLEIYPPEAEATRTNETDKYVIDLSKAIIVTDYTESKTFPSAIAINLQGSQPIYIAGENDNDTRIWKLAIGLLINKTGNETRFGRGRSPVCLNERGNTNILNYSNAPLSPNVHRNKANNNIYHELHPNDAQGVRVGEFAVHINPNAASKQNNLCGLYTMLVRNNHVLLRTTTTHNDVMVWPLADVLKFKTEETTCPKRDLITLEAGIKCLHRGGVFQFYTAFGKELVKLVKDATKESLGGSDSLNRNSVHQSAQSNRDRQDQALQQTSIKANSGPAGEKTNRTHSRSFSDLPLLPERASRRNGFRKSSAPADHSMDRVRKDSGFSEGAAEMNNNTTPVVQRCRDLGFHDSEVVPPPPPPRPRHTLTQNSLPVKRTVSH